MYKICIIEDDQTLREELACLLKNAGYETVCLTDFHDITGQLVSTEADLILLDITLPEENGEMILKKFRKQCDTPIIMLTSRTSEWDEVLSMSYGADDYVTKPYHPTILLLRISAVLKRSTNTPVRQSYHGAVVNMGKGTITRNGREIVLTKNEMLIFQLLLDHQGEIVTRDALITALWDNSEFIGDNTLSVNVSRLRGKLAELELPDAIETRKKQGYILK